MGESKRRKSSLGEDYGKEERIYSWLPLTKAQGKQFYEITTKGAWLGIAGMVILWLTVRVIGPGFGWWTVE
jgi:hypothetical protein